jgi:hypothetical protein
MATLVEQWRGRLLKQDLVVEVLARRVALSDLATIASAEWEARA